jgi:Immunity protein 21
MARFDWLDDGAIQLALPERLLQHWHGGDSSDYERACACSDDWLTRISVGDGLGLALGGDPVRAVVVPEADQSVAIVRWMFAEDEGELVEFALRGEQPSRTEPDLVFPNTDSEWRLFDAATDPLKDESPFRVILLPTGSVRVQTAYLESERNAAIVHRFRRET